MDPDPARLVVIDSTYPLIGILVIAFFMLILLALFSATEVAYFSTSKQRFQELITQYPKQAAIYQKLLNRPVKLQSTLNFGSVFFKLTFIICFIELKLLGTDMYLQPFWSNILIFFIIVFCIVFLGEILPRMYAYRNTNPFIRKSIRTIAFFNVLFTPLTFPLRKVSIWLTNKLETEEDHFSVEQLSQALEMTDYSETTEEEQKILEGIVSFGSTEVSQVMTPRINVFALKQSEPFHDILPKIISKGYSRIPVYEDSIDQIIGILFIKDLIPYVDKKIFNWPSILREVYYIPENKKLDDLLKDFQTSKNHLAVVVDEFGETSGIITLEDVLEEIVGDIADEFDEEDILYTQISEHEFLFDGKISMKDFYRVLPVDEDEFESHRREAESLAGFILEQVESFPQQNDVIPFANCIFTITLADKRRLQQIKVTLTHETVTD